MNPWRWVDPRVRSVRVADVQAYLLGRGWSLGTAPNPNTLLFEKRARGGSQPIIQALPASEAFDDYTQRIAELITTLSELEERHPVEVLEAILRPASQARDTTPARPEGTNRTASNPSAEKQSPRKKQNRSA